MPFTNTKILDLKVFEPRVFKDERGYFFESYNENLFLEKNINIKFVQDNQSKSSYGVLRGLHFQVEPYAQTKLVRVLEGKILDVAVDIRENSKTYGKWFSIELSSENFKQLLIPKGFAHGFVVLSETAIVSYKCDNFYTPDCEGGIRYDDPFLNIDWKIDKSQIILSPKDLEYPFLKYKRE